jgi:probable rRNA maturation factor
MSAPLRLRVFIDNRAGRKGVPIARSFEQWVRAALVTRRRGRAEVNIALLDEREARELNRRFRGRGYATNVLSFPYEPLPGERSALLGELAICPAVVAREAREQDKPVRDHFAHLTVHGVLHLLGHDHETRRDAAKMEAIERRVLSEFGIRDPYS